MGQEEQRRCWCVWGPEVGEDAAGTGGRLWRSWWGDRGRSRERMRHRPHWRNILEARCSVTGMAPVGLGAKAQRQQTRTTVGVFESRACRSSRATHS